MNGLLHLVVGSVLLATQFAIDLPVAKPGAKWRSASHRFALANLDAGTYRLALSIDDTPAGTYALTIVP